MNIIKTPWFHVRVTLWTRADDALLPSGFDGYPNSGPMSDDD